MSSDPRTEPGSGEVLRIEDETGPLLRFSGRIDREAVRRFRRLVPPTAWPVRADLSAVTTIDPAGMELLVHLSRKPQRRGQQLPLLAVPPELETPLVRAGLSRLLTRPDGAPTST